MFVGISASSVARRQGCNLNRVLQHIAPGGVLHPCEAPFYRHSTPAGVDKEMSGTRRRIEIS
jgi:hypothetical protein